MDEVEGANEGANEGAKDKTKSLNGFQHAHRKPVQLLLGLVIGLGVGWIPALLTPILAPLPPLIVGGILTMFPRTQAVALGMIAAACGIVAFLVGMLVIQVIL